VPVHLHAQVLEAGERARTTDRPSSAPDQLRIQPGAVDRVGDREATERCAHRLDLARRHVRLEKASVDPVLLEQNPEQRDQQPCVRARPHGEVDVRQLRRLGAARIDDDQGPRRIRRDLLQRDACPGDRMRVPRVLA